MVLTPRVWLNTSSSKLLPPPKEEESFADEWKGDGAEIRLNAKKRRMAPSKPIEIVRNRRMLM